MGNSKNLVGTIDDDLMVYLEHVSENRFLLINIFNKEEDFLQYDSSL